MNKSTIPPVGLVLYDATSTYTNAVHESLILLQNIEFPISFLDYRKIYGETSLEIFDFIILHYSVRLPFDFISGLALLKLKSTNAFKIVWVQDEQDGLDVTVSILEYINADLVLSTIKSEELRETIYGASGINHINLLTGYSNSSEQQNYSFQQYQGRGIDCFYRGRLLPQNYGKLGYLKGEYSHYLESVLQTMGLKTFGVKDVTEFTETLGRSFRRC